MDLSEVVSHNAKLDILHPGSGEPIGLQFELLPRDNPKVKKKYRDLIDMRRHKAARNQTVGAIDDERASTELCKAAIVGWTWTKDKDGAYIGNWNGENPDFNMAILSDMLTRDWLREQVDQQMVHDQDFFRS